jgi:hypothetical protein
MNFIIILSPVPSQAFLIREHFYQFCEEQWRQRSMPLERKTSRGSPSDALNELLGRRKTERVLVVIETVCIAGD